MRRLYCSDNSQQQQSSSNGFCFFAITTTLYFCFTYNAPVNAFLFPPLTTLVHIHTQVHNNTKPEVLFSLKSSVLRETLLSFSSVCGKEGTEEEEGLKTCENLFYVLWDKDGERVRACTIVIHVCWIRLLSPCLFKHNGTNMFFFFDCITEFQKQRECGKSLPALPVCVQQEDLKITCKSFYFSVRNPTGAYVTNGEGSQKCNDMLQGSF